MAKLPDHLFNGKPPSADQVFEALRDEAWERDYPCLHALMTFGTVNGEARELSTVTVGIDGGGWFARLIDHHNSRSLTSKANASIGEALTDLEARFNSARSPEWFYWRKKGTPKK